DSRAAPRTDSLRNWAEGSGTHPFSGKFSLTGKKRAITGGSRGNGWLGCGRSLVARQQRRLQKIGATRRRLNALSLWGGRGHEYGFWKRFGDDTARRVRAVPPARRECGIPLARRFQYGIHEFSETLPS